MPSGRSHSCSTPTKVAGGITFPTKWQTASRAADDIVEGPGKQAANMTGRFVTAMMLPVIAARA
jgi:hypothetical protein